MFRRTPRALGLVAAILLVTTTTFAPKANGQRTFEPAVGAPVGGNALSIAAGDLDNDGNMDIVAANGLDQTISVLLGNGNATFLAPITYASSVFPVSIILGDFDGDADLDIAAANRNNDKISIFKNNGNGTFLPQVQYGTGGPLPASLATADLNGDGDLDLAVGLGNFIAIMLNHGGGTFPIPTLYVTSAPVGGVAIGDLDGDGDNDVVGAKSNTNAVAVLLNRGTGFFQAPVSVSIADTEFSNGVAVSDVDYDGDLDIVSANGSNGPQITETVSVLLNDGSATFGSPTTYRTGDEFTSASSVELRDMDGDGMRDIVVAHVAPNSPPTVSVLYSIRGNGSFRTPLNVGMLARADYPMTIRGMAVADFNGDGQLDIAASGVTGTDRRVALSLNRAPVLNWPVNYATGTTPVAVESADLDGDTDLDLIVACQGDGKFAVHHNNGDGTFAAPVFTSTGPDPSALSTGDLDADNDIDVVVGRLDGSTNPLTVHWNNGAGAFSALAHVTLNATFPTRPISLAIANLDADSDLDLVTANSTFRNTLVRNNGNGTFTVSDIGTSTSNWDAKLGDLDGDGDNDYVADSGATLAVRKNNGSGVFTPETFTSIGFGQFSLALKDLDGDLDLDIAMALNSTGLGARVLNNGDGMFAPPLRFAHGGGRETKVVAADFDRDGDSDLAYASYSASNVTLVFNDGAAGLRLPIPTPAGSNPRSLNAADFDGDGDVDLAVANETSGDVSILFNGTVTTDVRASARTFSLAQNYPNPFNPSTTITFELPVRSRVSAQIFNVRGQLIRTLLEGVRPQGTHMLQWNGRASGGEALSSGVYFLRFVITGADGIAHSKVVKMVLLK